MSSEIESARQVDWFRWICLLLALVFLSATAWILNDIRLQVRQSAVLVRETAETIKDKLPSILERSSRTSEILSENLPDVVDRVNTTTEVVAELAEDLRQLKELAGVTSKMRDQNLVAYADGVLSRVAQSGGMIGVKKTIGSGLKNLRPAEDWVAATRKEALVLTILVSTKKDMLRHLTHTKLGASWWIELPGKQPITLLDWVRANHPESKNLS